ncbi:TRAP transporter substrate-binding protein [Cupriavidus neocaledonicus]|uniref:ABC transporter substrate-binding protein n=1 Tax=Cupriavidus neocaledonicus TaxID=1040979 RepID=A0A375H8C2_9BURK|nr:TRAP transporter substrate-binding protein [Cupriavidus neocaledonicus]SOZ36281.1 TRAP-type transporter, periplasmic component [Cupriavidus neocaledonicus]SPD48241.1 ABC transporter substrate-binding protein [Cupriavidus neocaledonicus]
MVNRLTRRQFGALAAGALALALPGRKAFAQNATIKLRYGTAFPADHPGTLRITQAAEAIRRDTGGKVDLQVYPNSQLGSEPDMVSQVLAGAIDFMSTASTNLQTRVPAASINGVAFAFKDYTTVWAAMDGGLGAYVRDALGKVNLHVFEKCLDNGYRNITSATRPVNTPADLKGFKIRVPAIPLWVSMFRMLGAAPTVIPFADLYSALQTRVVDGQETPLSLIRSGKLYEVQKFCSMTAHTWDGHFIFGNARKFQALPREVQASLTTRFATAALKQREDIARLDVEAQAEMTRLGIAFNRPDPAPFRKLLRDAGFYAEWRRKFGDEAWEMLEKYTGPLV